MVPEIEMPGHATAALAAYPEPPAPAVRSQVFPFFKGPNVHRKDVFCAGNDGNFSICSRMF